MLRLISILLLFKYAISYIIYTVDDPLVCNQSIYLERGPNSAAILKMTAKDSYNTAPLYCSIRFKVPIHNWSGLTGILEDVDMRTWDDTSHHLGAETCVDYISVDAEKQPSKSSEKQCGTWFVTPGEPLTKLGYNRALVGYCPHTVSWDNNDKCHVTELKVTVSVGLEKQNNLWSNHTWRPHRGFTFVVTAYSYPIKNGESECRDGLRSCSQANTPGSRLGVYHCVHDSLWCDGHVNCGLLENMDEIACFRKGIWGGLVTVVIGPWMGASILLLLAFCGILYWRSSRLRMVREPPITNQEINSYAESYELSSNLSSAHQMAIQVRVVCNSNHPHHGNRGRLQSWQNDLPPSYDALFPQGPPQPYTADNSNAQNLTASITATMAGGGLNGVSTLGVNVTATTTRPTAVVTSASNSSTVEACTNSQTTPSVSSNIIANTTEGASSIEGPVIGFNVTRKSLIIPQNNGTAENSSISSIDATISGSTNTQASVRLTVYPNQQTNTEKADASTYNKQPKDSNSLEINNDNDQIELAPIDNLLPDFQVNVIGGADNTNEQTVTNRNEEGYIESHHERKDDDSCTESDDNSNEHSNRNSSCQENSCGLSIENGDKKDNYVTSRDSNDEVVPEITSPRNETDYPTGFTVIVNPCGSAPRDISERENNLL